MYVSERVPEVATREGYPFGHPSMLPGPEALWLWNGELSASSIDEQLGAAHGRGLRSLAVWPWAGLTTPFLDETYLAAVRDAAECASRAGITLWLADDMHWPSGTAAGQLLDQTPDTAQRALVCSTRWTSSVSPQTLRWRGEGEQLVMALALDEAGGRRDMTQQLGELGRAVRERHTTTLDGYRARWEVDVWESELRLPPGEWFVTIATVVRLHPLLRPAVGCAWSAAATGALDVLSEAAIDRFVAHTLAPLTEAAGPHAGQAVSGFVSVAPPALLPHAVTRAEGWRTDVLPWMPDLAAVFEELFDRQLAIHLPYALAPLHEGAPSPPIERLLTYAEERRDELFTRRIGEWCETRGLGRLVMEAPALERLPVLPLSVRGERKRAFLPENALLTRTGEIETVPLGAVGSLSALRAPASTERAWEALVAFGEEWEWRTTSANVLPLGDWSEWQHVGRARDGSVRFDLDLSFEVDYVPEEVALLFEEGVVQSVALNRTILALETGRLARPDEIEAADGSYRVVVLPRSLVGQGRNTISAAAMLLASDRVSFEGGATGGPLFLMGQFALSPEITGVVGDGGTDGVGRAPRWRVVRPGMSATAGDWREQGYPRYSGSATYAQTITLPTVPEGTTLRLAADAFGGPVALRVDGHPIDRAAGSPFVFDVPSRPAGGLTRIEIECASGLGGGRGGGGEEGMKPGGGGGRRWGWV
ncbi:MAG: hypothetical protein ACR2NO_10700, partial [Chloroflexota bacterium]